MSPTSHTGAPSATASDLARLAPPQGWKTDPANMGLDAYRRGRGRDLKESLETDYGLLDPKPLLVRDPEYSDAKFLLQSKSSEGAEPKYYVWKDVEDELCWIKSPTSLKVIYRTMDVTEGYLSGLDMEVVHAKTEGGKQSARRK